MLCYNVGIDDHVDSPYNLCQISTKATCWRLAIYAALEISWQAIDNLLSFTLSSLDTDLLIIAVMAMSHICFLRPAHGAEKTHGESSSKVQWPNLKHESGRS